MLKIIKSFGVVALFFIICQSVYADNVFSSDSVEVGVLEHLGETIPMALTFKNEHDSTVRLADLINKPTVLALVYFDCPGICMVLLGGISDVIDKSDMELGKDFQVITISFNPADNPSSAREKKINFLGKRSKEHETDWHYLTGDSANIAAITNAVGFKYKRVGFNFVHPAVITILSPKGKITRYLYGTNYLPFDLKMAIYESRKGLSRPTIAKALELCYAYDPEGKRYALDVRKITGTLILFIILLFAGYLIISSRNRNTKKPS